MSDEDTTTTDTDAPATDAPEADAPTTEAPVADAQVADAESTDEAPAEEPEAPSHALDQTLGVTPAQQFGPETPKNVAQVEESFLTTDRVITDHNDPLATKYQFLGQSPPAPLPAGGASGEARKPEEIFASAGQ